MAIDAGWDHTPSTAGISAAEIRGAVVLPFRSGDSRDQPFFPGLFEAADLYDRLVSRLGYRLRRGSLAIIEIQNPLIADGCGRDQDVDFATDDMRLAISSKISDALGRDDIFCWHEGRFILLFSQEAGTRRTLRNIAHSIARCTYPVSSGHVNPTPAIGYLDLRIAKNAKNAQQMVETALDSAKSSLEIEPFRYTNRLSARYRPNPLIKSIGLWSKAPQSLALSVQFILSSMIGLGGPFILYAVCDAMGMDISGPIYLGVVAILIITATTIWIEGILSLKSTTPPIEPSSPHPLATVIIPAYLPNEADTIMDTLNAFLRLEYPNILQIIVAYNSPRALPVEEEMKSLAASLPQDGRFIVEPIRIARSTSKAQNVNAVIGNIRGSFVGIFDADHHPRPDSICRAWRWLSNGWDIVQGRCAIRNGGDSWVSRMVAIEFQQIYAVSHPGRARFHGFGIFGGSNGFWRTSVLHEIRMRHSMLTEDIDSSIRAVGAGYKIAGDRDLVSDELAPETLGQLLNQRLRWAQGWFQVSLQRVIPTVLSPQVGFRQKLGLVHLLIWRELFPWYSIQVLPIMAYWVWAYGWHYIHWAVPIFLATTIFTFSTGPAQIFFAYCLAEKPMKKKVHWFLEYFIVSTFFFSPFKDTLSRIAHIKEAMQERAWRVTPRNTNAGQLKAAQLARAASASLILVFVAFPSNSAKADAGTDKLYQYLSTILGGEVATISAARSAANDGKNLQAAELFEKAIVAVPSRRPELLREYADTLSYSGSSAKAVPLYRELLASSSLSPAEKEDDKTHLALALLWSRQFPQALSVYDDLLAQSPGNLDLTLHRAQVLSSMGESAAAVSALDNITPEKWSRGTFGALGDEILENAARKAAQADQNTLSANLFARAISHNPALKPALLREYADQLVYTQQAAAAVPLYHQVIDGHFGTDADLTQARLGLALALLQTKKPADASELYASALTQLKPDSVAYSKAQKGLALALTWSNQPARALNAWNEYLKLAPKDVDAMMHKAQTLSALHRDAQALDVYQAAYALDNRNEAIRHGIAEQKLNLARLAAREDENAESATLFMSAMNLDDRKTNGVLREYADQLNFAGRSAEAVAIYREVLATGSLSDLDRKRAMKGLADALAWSGQPVAALAAYTEVANAYPDDDNLRWTKLVFAARQAAQSSKNQEAVNLFASAIAIKSVPSMSILREYADQLSFSDRSAEAIPLYRAFLDQKNLLDPDKLSALEGLAQAYDWSGDQESAKTIYRQLLVEHPDDVSFQWDLAVTSAHEAAQKDRNKEAVSFFADAVRLLPDRRSEILREYADQLSFSGQSIKAIPLYQEVLSQPGLSDADRMAADKGLAQAYDWSGHSDQAKLIYSRLEKAYPDDVALRWGSLVFSAHMEAKEDRNGEAAILLAQAIQLMPSRRSQILKEYADKLTFSGKQNDAIALYRELIAQSGSNANTRTATLGLALALAWDHQFPAAIGEYQRLLTANNNDVDAKSGLAQTLSWSGHQSEAQQIYEQALAIKPRNPEAMRGLAQTQDWQGHHQAAQVILAQRLADDPDDLQARRLLAQSFYWMGRPDKAMIELNVAIGQVEASNAEESKQVAESGSVKDLGAVTAQGSKTANISFKSSSLNAEEP